MLFSTSVFIFAFLPFCIFVYYLIPRRNRKLQNIFLTVCSLFFYAWGEPLFVMVMFGSIIANWAFALWIEKQRHRHKFILTLAVVMNLSVFFIFKYLEPLTFTVLNMGKILNGSIDTPVFSLPIGISFFTFQAMSYVFDVYRKNGEVQKNPLNVSLYISFFPQLIAGPIVRYETVSGQINNRKETFDGFCDGACRFITGLAKKVILANNLASAADAAFAAQERSVAFAWLGALAYTFQIFYDFSGYSDMAIGLGKMFGFNFLENFNYPYISKSISEFWRRWHISLGTWFRDYVYFPLGGSRVKIKSRLVFNLFAVWFLTGVWHGENFTFLLWGLMYFALITAEKIFRREEPPAAGSDKVRGRNALVIIKRLYTLFFVVMGWVLFRAESIPEAFKYMGNMFGIKADGFYSDIAGFWFNESWSFLLFALLFSFPAAKIIGNKLRENKAAQVLYPVMMTALVLITFSYIVKGSYNPFIYFNF